MQRRQGGVDKADAGKQDDSGRTDMAQAGP
jgi:hypothetical protein